ncbi:MAG: hypothetical protein ACREX9_21430 [Gammaproteobacteria bacterium]
MRAQVLEGGARPQGLSAILYHGITRGLHVIGVKPSAVENSRPPSKSALPPVPLDAALLRLMANMVLHIQSEVNHVY